MASQLVQARQPQQNDNVLRVWTETLYIRRGAGQLVGMTDHDDHQCKDERFSRYSLP